LLPRARSSGRICAARQKKGSAISGMTSIASLPSRSHDSILSIRRIDRPMTCAAPAKSPVDRRRRQS
jgi:hypothetical protein